MKLFNKLSIFLEKYAADWKVFHQAERKYLESPAGIAKGCGKGIAHWAFASVLAIYYGVSLLCDGRITEVPARDIISSSWIIMFGFAVLRAILDYRFDRLRKKWFLAYVAGAAIGAVTLVLSLPKVKVNLFATEATLQYLACLFAIWGLCEFAAFALIPVEKENEINRSKKQDERGKMSKETSARTSVATAYKKIIIGKYQEDDELYMEGVVDLVDFPGELAEVSQIVTNPSTCTISDNSSVKKAFQELQDAENAGTTDALIRRWEEEISPYIRCREIED